MVKIQTGKYRDAPCLRCGALRREINPAYLRAVRTAAEKSLREVARELKRSAPYLSDIERGHRRCPLYILDMYEKMRMERLPTPRR